MIQANLNYTNWKACEENAVDDREKNKKYIDHMVKNDEICPIFSNHSFDLKIRLGSDSVNAEVYLYKKDSSSFALKVMPYDFSSKTRRERSYKEILNEITISQNLTTYSINNKYNHYPIMYGSVECSELSFSPQSTLGKQLDSGLGYIAVFELLSFDLKYLLQNLSSMKGNPGSPLTPPFFEGESKREPQVLSIPEEKLFEWISQIFDVIDNLNNKQGICHNDLHIANVMFRCPKKERDDDLSLVLIDFGKSVEISTISHNQKDLKTFFVSLRTFIEQNNSISQTYNLFSKAVYSFSYSIKSTSEKSISTYKDEFLDMFSFVDDENDSN